ncbi:MAG: GerMN domain-containing protein [Actinomycetota bacterium]|nr:GerMN domain-containing protein [Actinomycetota bacterium]
MVKGRQAQLTLVLAALIIVIAVTIAGCAKLSSRSGIDVPDRSSNHSSKDRQNVSPNAAKIPEKKAESATETIGITLYFGDDQGEKLVKEVRSVPMTEAVAKVAVEELIKGPTQGGEATMPKGTRLLDISVKDGIADVNLSKEFVDNHPGGSAGERLTVYSVVDTLTEFSTIKQVRFLVEGATVDTIAGHMDVSQPVQREESVL